MCKEDKRNIKHMNNVIISYSSKMLIAKNTSISFLKQNPIPFITATLSLVLNFIFITQATKLYTVPLN